MNLRAFALCLPLFMYSTHAMAFSLSSWFENINQRAARLMSEKKYTEAEALFTRPDWKATAAYRAEKFKAAAEQFKSLGGELGLYNHGNALAQQKQYQEAIKAYDAVLKINPKHEDAKYNRDLLKKLLEENPPQQDQNQNQDQNQDQNQEQHQDQNKQQNQEQQKKQEQQQDQNQEAPSQPEEKSSTPEQERQEQQEQQKKPQDNDKKQQDQNKSQQDQEQKEQALRVIPDDPGGLLREKFWRDHWRRLKESSA